MIDKNDVVIYAGIIKTKVLLVPRSCRILLVGGTESRVLNDCSVYRIETKIQQEVDSLDYKIDEKTSVTSYSKIEPSQVDLPGYLSIKTPGLAVAFGVFGEHTIYSIEPGKRYKITIKQWPGGNAYCYAITDENDIILQGVNSGDIFGEDYTAPKYFTFNVFDNQAKLYIS